MGDFDVTVVPSSEAKDLDDGFRATAIDARGRVRSRIRGRRRPALLRGEEVSFVQVTEVYNDFDSGAGLARANALQAAGEAFARELGGHAPEGHPVMFGVPNRRAHRFGLRRFKWEILRSEGELRVRPTGLVVGAAPGVEVIEAERFPDEVDLLFRNFAASREAILIRDVQRLEHRYGGRGCVVALARKGGALAGYAVYDSGRLVDWVVPAEDVGVAGALCVWADERARAEGHERLATTFPDTAPEWMLFQRLGFHVHAGHDYTVFRSFQKPFVMSWLFQNWYYTPGDLALPRG